MGSNSLDSLAVNGIINFDADAFIKGTPPRYAGSPEEPLYLPFDKPIPDVFESHGKVGHGKNASEGESDNPFISKIHGNNNSSSFKNFLMIALVGGVGAYLIAKRKSLSSQYKNIKGKTENFFANCKEKMTSTFKSKPKTKTVTPPVSATSATAATVAASSTTATATAATTGTTAAAKEEAKGIKGFLSKFKALKWGNMPKWGKITTLSSAGLLTLYGAYRIFGAKPQAEAEQPRPILHG